MSMDTRDYDASLDLLPADLRTRVEALRDLTVRRTRCTPCLGAQRAVRLVFDAAYLRDLPAARAMMADAERHVRERHELGCRIWSPASPDGRSTLRGRLTRWSGTTPVVAATDAGRKRRYGGLGYVSSDGHWGLRGWLSDHRDPSGPAQVLVNELRAVELLLRDLGEDAADITVLVDSAGARNYLRRWQRGDVDLLPSGYDLRVRYAGRPPTLVRLAERVASMPGLTVGGVKAHTGHLLNEAADALATMARRRLEERVEVRERAAELVRAFLLAWHDSDRPAEPPPPHPAPLR